MGTMPIGEAAGSERTDNEIVERVKAGDTALYEIIMRRYNQRLYRVGRAILRDDAESEDVMQDATCAPTNTSTSSPGALRFPLGSRASPSTKLWPASACAPAIRNSTTSTTMENLQ
jgi:hypothetical protein